MSFKHCGTFKAGTPVPAWLLDVEPGESGAERPTLRFTIDCHIVETSGGYFMVPDAVYGADSMIYSRDGRGDVTMMAPSRTFIMPLRFQIMGGGDDRGGEDEPSPTTPMPSVSA